jgi:cell division protein ZapD
MRETILYEQPLNEVIRACLRLEQLFAQVDYCIQDQSAWGARQVIYLITNILYLVDRPDLKSKLAKELNQQLSSLARLNNIPEIDTDKLQQLTAQLTAHIQYLIESSGKIGQRLREVELLNTLRLHLANPGGGCSFDVPLYHHWLQQPNTVKHAIMSDWITEFAEIRTAITLLLDLVRRRSHWENKQAVSGFYQELLDPQLQLRMICLNMSDQDDAFPEISVGRHFLSVRFYIPTIQRVPAQYTGTVNFSLAYCHL